MTETTIQNDENAPQTPENASEAPQAEAAEDTSRNGNHEAAKYRRQLRDVEKDRDSLRAQLVALQRATAESIASAHLDKPNALWANGTDLATLLDDEGNVDPAKVQEAAVAAREELGLMPRAHGPVIPNQGAFPETVDIRPGFEAAFAPRS